MIMVVDSDDEKGDQDYSSVCVGGPSIVDGGGADSFFPSSSLSQGRAERHADTVNVVAHFLSELCPHDLPKYHHVRTSGEFCVWTSPGSS
jgi:hypothetical protein